MFDLGIKRDDAIKYLKAIKDNIDPDLTENQIDDLALDLVDERGDLYDFALHFVHGLYREYCERNNLDDLDLLHANDDAREFLPRFFLEHFISIYNNKRDEYLNSNLLYFAFVSMTGEKAIPEFEHRFSYYFWNFYYQFEQDVFEIYRDYQSLLLECEGENEQLTTGPALISGLLSKGTYMSVFR